MDTQSLEQGRQVKIDIISACTTCSWYNLLPMAKAMRYVYSWNVLEVKNISLPLVVELFGWYKGDAHPCVSTRLHSLNSFTSLTSLTPLTPLTSSNFF